MLSSNWFDDEDEEIKLLRDKKINEFRLFLQCFQKQKIRVATEIMQYKDDTFDEEGVCLERETKLQSTFRTRFDVHVLIPGRHVVSARSKFYISIHNLCCCKRRK